MEREKLSSDVPCAYGFCFASCPKVPALTSCPSIQAVINPFLPKLLLVTVFITALATLTRTACEASTLLLSYISSIWLVCWFVWFLRQSLIIYPRLSENWTLLQQAQGWDYRNAPTFLDELLLFSDLSPWKSSKTMELGKVVSEHRQSLLQWLLWAAEWAAMEVVCCRMSDVFIDFSV